MKRIEQMTRIEQLNLIDAAIEVRMIAEDIFKKCGVPDDFAVQGPQAPTVFGSVNRIKLTAYGWKAFPDHCTPRFMAAFKKMQGGN